MDAPPRPPPDVSALPPSRLGRWLAWSTAVIAALGLAAELAYARAPEAAAPWVSLLSLSYEGNVPTWYASSLLFAAALLLATEAAAARRRQVRDEKHWWALAALFALMSLDETAQLHENLYVLIDGRGIFYFSWVVPGAALALAVAVAFAPFWRRLPPVTRRRFAIAGAIYLAGALVMELPLGYWTERQGSDNLGYALIDFVEESLELSGASLFLASMARHRAGSEVKA